MITVVKKYLYGGAAEQFDCSDGKQIRRLKHDELLPFVEKGMVRNARVLDVIVHGKRISRIVANCEACRNTITVTENGGTFENDAFISRRNCREIMRIGHIINGETSERDYYSSEMFTEADWQFSRDMNRIFKAVDKFFSASDKWYSIFAFDSENIVSTTIMYVNGKERTRMHSPLVGAKLEISIGGKSLAGGRVRIHTGSMYSAEGNKLPFDNSTQTTHTVKTARIATEDYLTETDTLLCACKDDTRAIDHNVAKYYKTMYTDWLLKNLGKL